MAVRSIYASNEHILKVGDRIAWENSKGFKSFGTICDEFYKTIDPTKFKSLQEVKDTVATLNDYLEIGQNLNGDYYVDSKEYSNTARYIMNNEKMYIVGTTVYKKVDNRLISCSILEKDKIKIMKDNDIAKINDEFSVKQQVPYLPVAGLVNHFDLWGAEKKVNGQTYVQRVILETEIVGSNPPVRRDRISIYNYKWTLWIYWGDYNTYNDIKIRTQTLGLALFNVPYGLNSQKYIATGTYVYRTVYSLSYSGFNYQSYYNYYNVDTSNGRGCTVVSEYGTETLPCEYGVNLYN